MEELEYSLKLAQRKEKAEAQAKKYFYEVKQRKAYYRAEGVSYDESECDKEVFLHFTDEEIARIKELIINDVNEAQITPHPVSTVEEALEALYYGDLFNINEELRKLVLERCEELNFYPIKIDYDQRYYFYKFSCLAYDYEGKKVFGPITVDIILSDEEYLTLLTLQLLNREDFNFNHLFNKNMNLAAKLNEEVQCRVPGWCCPSSASFVILFDEVRADAEIIDGPLPE